MMDTISLSAQVISALATVAALIFARGAVKEAKRLYELEQSRDKTQDAEKRREQASLFCAWIATEIDAQGNWKRIGILLNNASSAPVFNIKITLDNSKSETAIPLLLDTLPPGKYFCQATPATTFQDFVALDSGKTSKEVWAFTRDIAEFSCIFRPITLNSTRKIRTITFSDSNNHRWQRDALGKLTQIDLLEHKEPS